MALGSTIEWTESTWNPVTGCARIRAGCRHGYAERMAMRLKAMGQPNYANGFQVTLPPQMLPRADVEVRRRLPPTGALSRWGHEIPAAERRALRLLCIAHRVSLLVHGHLHRAEDRRVNGVRIVGAPASTEPGPDGALPVLRYEVDGEPPRVTVTPVRVPV
jgi:hypothetical protein